MVGTIVFYLYIDQPLSLKQNEVFFIKAAADTTIHFIVITIKQKGKFVRLWFIT
jgi:hypothetical protein